MPIRVFNPTMATVYVYTYLQFQRLQNLTTTPILAYNFKVIFKIQEKHQFTLKIKANTKKD